nr:hypothetical protein CFP56_62661 [Quercus suber]
MRQKTLAVTDEPSDPMRRHRTQQANRANEPTNERLGFLPTNAGADEPRRRRACSSPNPSVFLRLLVGVAGFVGQNRRLGSSARNPGARSLVTARNPGARSSFVGHARRGLRGQRPKNEVLGFGVFWTKNEEQVLGFGVLDEERSSGFWGFLDEERRTKFWVLGFWTKNEVLGFGVFWTKSEERTFSSFAGLRLGLLVGVGVRRGLVRIGAWVRRLLVGVGVRWGLVRIGTWVRRRLGSSFAGCGFNL